ncbi:MAG: polyprenyl synthetase family protein [Treponema sp.]|jgi:octaprenyl-diphosphate synthase|nr:polyprenyl synthetase family protein [Treponema sp.]
MDREYTRRIETIEAALEKYLPPLPGQDWLAGIFPGLDLNGGLCEDLLAPGRDLLCRGGKRWRPLLSLLVCQALGGGEAALPLLPLVEFPHNASLIHDDLEDQSEERRGSPAVHLLYGNDTAVNSGSFLYFLPLAALENWEAGDKAKTRVWKLWGEHMRRLHLGQSLDIAWHRDPALVPSREAYMLMCRLKTGCLARFAALLGVEAARSVRGEAEQAGGGPGGALGEAAEKIGVGFQILDDVKNVSAGTPGKKRGDDVVEGKKSLPVILFLRDQILSPREREGRSALIRRCFEAARKGGAGVPEVEECTGALARAGVLEAAAEQGRVLIREAAETFASLPALDPEAGGLLARFAELLS